MVILAGLACPAEIYNFADGQTGALTVGFFVTERMCFDSKPTFGGSMAGLLCIKPQIGLALPLILLRRRYLKPLLLCLVIAGLMILRSVLVEGWQAWVWFITVAEPKTTLILNAPLEQLAPSGLRY